MSNTSPVDLVADEQHNATKSHPHHHHFHLPHFNILGSSHNSSHAADLPNANSQTNNHSHHHLHESTNEHKFQPKLLHEALLASLCKSDANLNDFDDVSLKEFLNAYEEIVKFLEMLGTLFYFVITDVREKINILEEFLTKEPVKYKTIKSMIEHELEEKQLQPPTSNLKTNGSRTLLRLHRAMEFIYKLLDRLYNADPKLKSPQVCTETYEGTLGKHHSWFIRKAVTIGMHALPKREVLIGYMIHNNEDREKFPLFIETSEKVFTTVEKLFQRHNLLNLP